MAAAPSSPTPRELVAMPAAASGTSMNPDCAIEDQASRRTTSVWRSAPRLPIVIVSAARIASTVPHALAVRPEPEPQDDQEAGEAAGLRHHGQERRHPDRRTDVGVGDPPVERHGRDLEQQAGEQQRGPDRRDRGRGRPGDERGREQVEVQRAGDAVQQGGAEQHHGERHHRDEERLERGLGAPTGARATARSAARSSRTPAATAPRAR